MIAVEVSLYGVLITQKASRALQPYLTSTLSASRVAGSAYNTLRVRALMANAKRWGLVGWWGHQWEGLEGLEYPYYFIINEREEIHIAF